MDIATRNDFSSADVREFWDGVADIYDRANDQVRDAHDQRYHESFTYFPTAAPATILNIWSRTGEAVEFLRGQQLPSTVINIEVSLRLINIARARGRHGRYAQTDLTDLPVHSRSVDLVLSLETLEHCPDPRSSSTPPTLAPSLSTGTTTVRLRRCSSASDRCDSDAAVRIPSSMDDSVDLSRPPTSQSRRWRAPSYKPGPTRAPV